MPVKSEAQRRLMYAAAEGKVAGVSPKVGREFIAASHGMHDLPPRVGKDAPKRKHKGKH